MSVDDTDLEVLKALFDLEDPSPGAIAEETGIPTSTVHYRLDGLKQEGIIKNELYEIDANALGLGVQLISEVNAEYEEGYHVRFVGEPEGLTTVAIGIHEPAVTVRHATLDDTAIVAGERVPITMTIANEGLAEGTRTLELLADGATVATERVRLEAGVNGPFHVGQGH